MKRKILVIRIIRCCVCSNEKKQFALYTPADLSLSMHRCTFQNAPFSIFCRLFRFSQVIPGFSPLYADVSGQVFTKLQLKGSVHFYKLN